MVDFGTARRICSHCGAVGSRRLGTCEVCGLSACDRCGNTQHSLGDRKVVHDECLKSGADGTFSMIKFIK